MTKKRRRFPSGPPSAAVSQQHARHGRLLAPCFRASSRHFRTPESGARRRRRVSCKGIERDDGPLWARGRSELHLSRE